MTYLPSESVKVGMRLAAFAFKLSAWTDSEGGKPARLEAFAIEAARKIKR